MWHLKRMLHCNSRTTNKWKRLEIISIKCPVCVFRACLSAFKVSQLSSEFFGSNLRYVQVDESQYEPLLVKEVLFLLLLSATSPLCARTFLCQMCTSPDQAYWQLWRDSCLQPPITPHALHPFIMLWASHMGCTWIESCVVMFAVLRLSLLRITNKSNSFETDLPYFQKGPVTYKSWLHLTISREQANLKYISNICSLFLFTIRTDNVDWLDASFHLL